MTDDHKNSRNLGVTRVYQQNIMNNNANTSPSNAATTAGNGTATATENESAHANSLSITPTAHVPYLPFTYEEDDAPVPPQQVGAFYEESEQKSDNIKIASKGDKKNKLEGLEENNSHVHTFQAPFEEAESNADEINIEARKQKIRSAKPELLEANDAPVPPGYVFSSADQLKKPTELTSSYPEVLLGNDAPLPTECLPSLIGDNKIGTKAQIDNPWQEIFNDNLRPTTDETTSLSQHRNEETAQELNVEANTKDYNSLSLSSQDEETPISSEPLSSNIEPLRDLMIDGFVAEDPVFADAVAIGMDEQNPMRGPWWKRKNVVLTIIGFIILAVVLNVAITATLSNRNGAESMVSVVSTALTNHPSLSPSYFPSLSSIPSKTPSLSPISKPSLNPSSLPTFSISPSVSFSPTVLLSETPSETCYSVQVNILFDDYPEETRWRIKYLDASDELFSSAVVMESPDSDSSESSQMEHCLKEGQYQFEIYDSEDDGMCCEYGIGQYNVTSYGEVIKEGGEFEDYETTYFDLPFTTTPSASPTFTLYPSAQPSVSNKPSVSIGPTYTLLPSLDPTRSISMPCNISITYETNLLQHECNCFPEIAVDGDVTVLTDDHSVYFFVWNDGIWKTEEEFSLVVNEHYFSDLPVAIYGNITVVGVYTEDRRTGAIYIFERLSNGTWFQSAHIVPDDIFLRAEFGCSVDIDGEVIVVGAQYDRAGRRGSAFVYQKGGSSWELKEKFAPEAFDIKMFGIVVAIKGDLIAISDFYHGPLEEGTVFIYSYETLTQSWVPFHERLSNEDCDKHFGSALYITQNQQLLVGCRGEDSYTGAVYYYMQSDEGEGFKYRQKIVASQGSSYDLIGGKGKISVNKKVMTVGSYNDSNGSVYIFFKQNDFWEELSKMDAPEESRFFGKRVALSGNKLIVGSKEEVQSYTLICS